MDDAAHQCGSMNPISPRTLPAFPVLLLCGLAASFVYVAADLIAAATYPGYSFVDQAVSELFAIGAPTSQMIVPLFSLSSALLLGFAAGIAASSAQNRALRLLAMFAFRYATALDVGEPTPGLGLTERLAQYAYQVWQAALALLLLGGPKLRTPESVHL